MANDKNNNLGRNMQEFSEIESVRKRVGVIMGTNDEEGMAHGVYELIANSIDEAREGYGNIIKVHIALDNTTTVIDEGRGIPMHWNPNLNKYNWEIAFCKLYGSGKFDSEQYNTALGTNGLGLTSMNYASEYMEVESYYSGTKYSMRFEEGVPVTECKTEDCDPEMHGTKITCKPDNTVFEGATGSMPAGYFIDLIKRQAMLIPGLRIEFYHEMVGKEVVIEYPKGIPDFIKEVSSSPIMKEPVMYSDKSTGTDNPEINPEPYTVNMKIAFTFERGTSLLEAYHNACHQFETNKNYVVDALKNGMTKAFDKYLRENSKIDKKQKVIFKDIEENLICIATTDAPGNRTFFRNQTKGAINNIFIRNEFQNFVQRSMYNWLCGDIKNSKKAVELVLISIKAREAASKASKSIIEKLTKGVSFGDKPKYFKDCESNNPEECEIYIVEGRSAGGAIETARDPYFQACIPLTGKPLNPLKKTLEDALANGVISDLYRVLNCGISAKSKYIDNIPEFNINNLKFNKIILAADADIDGKHITILMLAIFYALSPELLKQGHVYIVETPLYKIEVKEGKKKRLLMAYSDNERDSVIAQLHEDGYKDSNIQVKRAKGLGENNADIMEITSTNPETRRLVQVDYPESEEEQKYLSYLFEAMLGNDIETRRALIDEFFPEIEADLD